MNLPNKLTLLRICMIPICVWLLLSPQIPYNYLLTMLVFSLASFTDMLDGKIARKRGIVTNFGKFMDPLADKMLVCSVLICFSAMGLAPVVTVIIVIFREFAISSLRLVAVSGGHVIAANHWGKVKTVTQMISIIAVLLLCQFTPANTAAQVSVILMWLVAGITVVSGATYIFQNRECIKEC